MLIEIFRTGTHTDSAGNTRTWTEEDLDAIVNKYNPANHEAPVVIGHPKDNAPAFGWVEGLQRKGSILYAKLKDLVPEFVDAVKKGLYKKRSISLYPDMTLRHVGFLGAVPPAVKGLADVKFQENISEMIYEFEDSPGEKAQKARSKKYGIGIKDGGNVTKPSEYESLDDSQFADPVNYRYPIDESHIRAALSYWGMPKNREQYSSAEVEIITRRILSAARKYGIEVDEEKWKFSEKEEDMGKIEELEAKLKESEGKIAEFEEKVKAKEDEIVRLKNELTKLRAEQRRAEFQTFCERLEREGRLTPAIKSTVMDFMEIMHGIGEYEFSEGEGKVKAQPIEKFKAFLSGLPKQVEFKEVATKGKVAEDKGKNISHDFSGKVDEERLEIHQRAMEFVEKEGISYRDALNKALKEG